MTHKCITFDKEAQDALPDHIKARMKADRQQAKYEQIVNKWIKEMQELGFTPDDMLRTIKLARKIYNEMKHDNR